MSTEHDFTPGSPQHSWLVQAFNATRAKRAAQPWLIFIGHRPMYR